MRVLIAGRNAKGLAQAAGAFANGLTIETATTKAAAVALLERAEFDLVIACEKLGDGSGLEVLSHVTVNTPNTLRIFAARPSTLQALKNELGFFGLFRTFPYPINFRKLWSTLNLAGSCCTEPDTALAGPPAQSQAPPRIRHVVLDSAWEVPAAEVIPGSPASDASATTNTGYSASARAPAAARATADPPAAASTSDTVRVTAVRPRVTTPARVMTDRPPPSVVAQAQAPMRNASHHAPGVNGRLARGDEPMANAAPVRNDEPTANAQPARNGGPRANAQPARNGGPRADASPARNGGPAANAAPARNGGPAANAAPARNARPAANASPARNARPAANAAPARNGGVTANAKPVANPRPAVTGKPPAAGRPPAAARPSDPIQASAPARRAQASPASAGVARQAGRIPESEAFKLARARRHEAKGQRDPSVTNGAKARRERSVTNEAKARREPSVTNESLAQLARLAVTRRPTYDPRSSLPGSKRRKALFVGSGVFAGGAAALVTFFMVSTNSSIGQSSVPLAASVASAASATSIDHRIPQNVLPWQASPGQPTPTNFVRNQTTVTPPIDADMEVEAEAASEPVGIEPGHPGPPPPNAPPPPAEPPTAYDASGMPIDDE